jgi:GTPase SAR1 family protein
MREQWMQSGHALLLLYSATSFASFRGCRQFVEEVLVPRHLHHAAPDRCVVICVCACGQIAQARGNPRHLPLILVETKVDLPDEREVPVEAGPAAAEAMGCFFARVSNKTREGVDEVMHAAARLALATTTGQMDALLLKKKDKEEKNQQKQRHNKKCLLS